MSFHDDDSQSSLGIEDGSDNKSTAGSTYTTRSNTQSVSSDEEQLAQKETTAVFHLRLLVLFALCCAAVLVSVAIYFITSNAEEQEFLGQFEGNAIKVLGSFEEIVGQKLGAIASLAVSFTSYARSTNATWPFVTMNDFQQRAASARSLSDSLFLELLPMVSSETRSRYEEYSLEEMGWLAEGRQYQEELGLGNRRLQSATEETSDLDFSTGIGNKIYALDETWSPVADPGVGPFFPIWQSSPVLDRDLVNYNLITYGGYGPGILTAFNKGEVAIGGIDVAGPGDTSNPDLTTSFFAFILSFAARKSVTYDGDPMSSVYLPVFESYDESKVPVGVIVAVINWAGYFENIFPPNSAGVIIVLENTCDGPFTYEIDGSEVIYLGQGDLHDTRWDHLERSVQLDELINTDQLGLTLNQDRCVYTLSVYPSQALVDHYYTNLPIFITVGIALIFVFTAGMFLLYDRLVERRQSLVMDKAERYTAVVSSLFPKAVRKRLMQDGGGASGKEKGKKKAFMSPKNRVKSFLNNTGNEDDENAEDLKPIADLFLNATVLFADISGFTAWSSTREPAQVFILLQTVYQAFDVIANRFRVFKVETIGDSYVAVTGVPNKQNNHAVLMAKFASACLLKMSDVVKTLEVLLGPDTADLSMRFGMNSGPVTAGVLRGERARFQLFGDTVNTAARLESTGIRNKIQVSPTTANLLIAANKGHWLQLREDMVQAKGKGLLQTYWLRRAPPQKSDSTSDGAPGLEGSQHPSTEEEKRGATELAEFLSEQKAKRQSRLVDWTVEILLEHIRQIVAKRKAMGIKSKPFPPAAHTVSEGNPLDEVAEVIMLPKFDRKAAAAAQTSEYKNVEIGKAVVEQLRDFVTIIADTYKNNPFHNFDHACHVTMAVHKLLKRVVAPDFDMEVKDQKDMASRLHDYTHGITSDPLSVLAILLSAVIHDVDHRGVSNTQLIKEDVRLADLYKNKSVAEQNSFDLAWDILMSDQYNELRACMFANETELLRFRQVLVNMVLATDIFDKELNDLRKNRWQKAFGENSVKENDTDLKATIVIEHIIQAADVSHTMQHWHIYRKWNEYLFHELYEAFQAGRMGADPSAFWYKGELGFFDNYVIPLAKKLKDCRVFGVSSDECLDYAVQNRAEWEQRGEGLVAEMIQKYAPKPDE